MAHRESRDFYSARSTPRTRTDAAKWEELANEALADVREWKRKAQTLRDALASCRAMLLESRKQHMAHGDLGHADRCFLMVQEANAALNDDGIALLR